MSDYKAGSVSAEIRLDTSKFDEGIKQLKKSLDTLKSDFKNVSIQSLAKQVKELQSESKQTSSSIKNLKGEVDKLTKSNNTLTNSTKKNVDAVKKQNDVLVKSNEKLATSTTKTVDAVKKQSEAIKTEQKVLDTEIKKKKEAAKANEQYAKSAQNAGNSSSKYNQVLSKFGNDFYKLTNQAWINSEVNGRKMGQVELAPIYNQLKDQYKGIVKNKKAFEKLLADSLMGTNSKLLPTRDPDKFVNVGGKNWGYIATSNLKKFSTSWKETVSSVKQSESELEASVKKSAEVIESSSNKSIQAKKKEADNLISSLKKTENQAKKTNASLNEINAQSNSEQRVKSTLKETKALSELNAEQRRAGLTAKRNERIYRNMELEAFNYINGLKRGRVSKGVLGTDTSLWSNFEGVKGRTKTFDYDRFVAHLKKTFKDVIPDDIFKDMFSKLGKQFEIGLAGWAGDRGGISEKGFNRLREYADMVKTIKDSKKREQNKSYKDMNEALGLGKDYYDFQLEKASATLDMFNRGLKTAAINTDKLKGQGKVFAPVEKELQTAKTALDTFNRGLNTTSVDLNKLRGQHGIFDPTISELKTAGLAMNNFTTNANKAKLAMKGEFLNTNQLKTAATALDTFNRGLKTTDISTQLFLHKIGEVGVSVKRSTEEIATAMSKFASISNPYMSWVKVADGASKVVGRFTIIKEELSSMPLYYEKVTTSLQTTSLAEEKFTQALLSNSNGVDIAKEKLRTYAEQTKATFETMQVELAKANAAQYKYWQQVRGSSDVKGWNVETLPIKGYNDYLTRIHEVNQGLIQLKQHQKEVNHLMTTQGDYSGANFKKAADGLKLLNQEYDKLANAQTKYTQKNSQLSRQINQLKTQIGHLSKASEGNAKAFAVDSRQLTTLSNKLNNLTNQYKRGKLSADEYRKGLDLLGKELSKIHTNVQLTTRDLQQTSTSMDKTAAAARASGRGLTSFNNGVQQTAHSGRILSNTLYQIRGALLSLKMIFTAMGGMALWGFAMDMMEGVKQTYAAKNEMESQLAQNSKVGRGGIIAFNKALDDTSKKFKKINKYSIGETVSSIGLEFELSGQQMAESMDVISMIQSEYVRAGRREDEAALAVKDILQGEFSRLSRETGVGKEELLAYGWSGDKSDVEGLMNALRKAAKDRNWDVFAAKATSLNDVLTITKSRFSEFGAELLDKISPVIVGAFNLILDAVTGVQKAFEGLGTFWGTALSIGVPTAGIGVLATGLMMVSKNMGLVDIATIGWKKSLITTAFNLNKTEVATYGLRHALLGLITKTDAATTSEIGFGKALLGRILGVDTAIQKEKGLLAGMVASHAALKSETAAVEKAGLLTGKWHQKLAYLTTNLSAADAAGLKWNESIKKMITSTKLWGSVLRTTLKSLIAITAISTIASIATEADKAKNAVEGYYNVVDNGDDLVASAQKSADNYANSISKLDEQIAKYKEQGKDTTKLENDKARALNNQAKAYANVNDAIKANALAKEYDEKNRARRTDIDLSHQNLMEKVFTQGGMDRTKATESANKYFNDVINGNYYINKGLDAYDDRLYKASQHIAEHVGFMKEAGAEQDQLNQYMIDYNTAAQEAADNWRKFNEGDLTAGLYALLSEARLIYIDLMTDKNVIAFTKSLSDAWKSWQPTIKAICDGLQQLAYWLMQITTSFLSTDWGGEIAKWGVIFGAGTLILSKTGILGFIKGVITNAPKAIEKLGKIKDKIKDIGGASKDAGKKMEESGFDWTGGNTTTGKDKNTPPTKPSPKDLPKEGDASWWEQTSAKLKQDATLYVRAAVAITAALALAAWAILLLNAPMLALAGTGALFKQIEPQVKQGIEGLKLIAPIMAILLPPIVALIYIFGKYGGELSNGQIARAAGKAAVGIAASILLVAEAIVLLIAPLGALAVLGWVREGLGSSVETGIEAMKTVNEALYALVPWIPVFAAGIILAAAAFSTGGIAGGLILVTAAAGIAAGILMVTEAIGFMEFPLQALAKVGADFPDLSGVEQGAKAIEITGKALSAIYLATSAITGTVIQGLATWLMTGGKDLGEVTQSLIDDEGFINDVREFIDKFNKMPPIPEPNVDNMDSLVKSTEGITKIADALSKVKEAIKSLGFGSEATPTQKFDSAVGKETDTVMSDLTVLDEQFTEMKSVIEQISAFIGDVNQLTINAPKPELLQAITQSAQFISEVKTAVDNVKAVVTGLGSVSWEAGYSNGGILGAVSAWITGNAGSSPSTLQSGGGSGLKAGLDEIYNALLDIMDFNTKVSSIQGASTEAGDNGNVSGIANMVVVVSQAISDLATTLQNAVPSIKTNGTNIGTAIKDGIRDGVNGLDADITKKVTSAIEAAKPSAQTYGKGLGGKAKEGFKQGIDAMSDIMNAEIDEIIRALTNRKQDVYDNAHAMGAASANGFRDGQDHHSPGLMARSMFEEIDYIETALYDAQSTVSDLSYNLGNSISSNFDVSGMVNDFSYMLNNASFDDIIMPSFDYSQNSEAINQFTSDVNQVSLASANTAISTQQQFGLMNTNVNTNFNSMGSTIATTFTNIKNNTANAYAQIAATTRTQLNNMQLQTTKNIGAIRTSWHGMQTALIASAEHIRSQTSQKIGQLQSNMASFWRKVQNPALLLGAGSPDEVKHTIRRRSAPKIKTPSSGKGTTSMRFAGGGFGRSKLGEKQTGISDSIQPKLPKSKFLLDYLAEYIQLVQKNGFAAAGGWNFNWSKDIQNALLKWHTHFGAIYDDVLTVGKFENDDFPVKGNATIAKRYIYDAISRTSYDLYYDSKYGNDPLAAWNAGSFNCWDGANIILALASAFGFGGGYMGHGSWSGTGHVWAVVPGLGVMDATAIQRGYGFTSPKVSGYGSKPRRYISEKKEEGYHSGSNARVVNVNVDLSNSRIYGIDDLDNHIETTTKKVMREEFNDPYSVPL